MFKFNKLICLAIIFAFMLVMPSLSLAEKVATFGRADSSGRYTMEADSDRLITYPGGGIKAKYELVTTNNSLAATESGITLIVEGQYDTSSTITITLPDADVGLEYTIVVGGSMTELTGGSGEVPTVVVNPQDTDYIFIDNAGASTYAVGDATESAGVTGDSLHVICAKDLYWTTVNSEGTWSDIN